MGVSRRTAAVRRDVPHEGDPMRNGASLERLGGLVAGESGQDLMEYGLLVSLIATFLVGALNLAGDQVDAIWQAIAAIQYR